MVVAAIVACEVAFWVFLAAGLLARYPLRRPRLGAALLLGSPAADVLLLVLTAVDLHGGAVASQAHAIAAVYLGFTVAFGHATVLAADRRFAHRFAGGPAPVRVPRRGPERVRHEWQQFGRAALAWGVATAVLLGLVLLTGDLDRTRVLLGYVPVLTAVLLVWLVTGPVPAVVAARRRPAPPAPRGSLPAREAFARPDTAGGTTMTKHRTTTPPTPPTTTTAPRWAPWWVYVVVILGANALRQALMPVGIIPEWAVVVAAVGLSAVLFVLVTAAFRTRVRPGRPPGDRSQRTPS